MPYKEFKLRHKHPKLQLFSILVLTGVIGVFLRNSVKATLDAVLFSWVPPFYISATFLSFTIDFDTDLIINLINWSISFLFVFTIAEALLFVMGKKRRWVLVDKHVKTFNLR